MDLLELVGVQESCFRAVRAEECPGWFCRPGLCSALDPSVCPLPDKARVSLLSSEGDRALLRCRYDPSSLSPREVAVLYSSPLEKEDGWNDFLSTYCGGRSTLPCPGDLPSCSRLLTDPACRSWAADMSYRAPALLDATVERYCLPGNRPDCRCLYSGQACGESCRRPEVFLQTSSVRETSCSPPGKVWLLGLVLAALFLLSAVGVLATELG